MTEEKKNPTFNEIIASFNEKCHCNYDNDYETEDCRPCDYCKILHPDYDTCECYQKGAWTPGCSDDNDSQGECLNHYIYEIATGKRTLDKPLWNPPNVELPEWLKVGAYVAYKGRNDSSWSTWQITELHVEDGFYAQAHSCETDAYCYFPIDVITKGKDARIIVEPIPEWFRVGARLWRWACNDWYTINEITPVGTFDDSTYDLFKVKMVASDGSEDEAELGHQDFTTESPFNFEFKVGKKMWCKPLGEWVTLSDYACDSNIITVVRENGYDYSTYLNNKMEADILVDEVPTPKRRPYTQEEAVQLIGKILSYEYKGERITRSVFEVSARGSRVKVDRTNQATWMERNATIDGQPFGVLITD